jgi:hypothetical protein
MKQGNRSRDDIEADLERLRRWLARPRTMDNLVARFRVERRTIQRWLGTLVDQGHEVTRVGLGCPTRYRIVP